MPEHSDLIVRPFERVDRDQLTDLVNTHVAAVVPGVSISVATLLSRLERDPGEFIVDPWVTHRATLVAVQRGRVVAGAHLQRYGDADPVPEHARLVGEITWLVISPDAPFWPDSQAAGDRLVEACTCPPSIPPRWTGSDWTGPWGSTAPWDRPLAAGRSPAPARPRQRHPTAGLHRAGRRRRGRVHARSGFEVLTRTVRDLTLP